MLDSTERSCQSTRILKVTLFGSGADAPKAKRRKRTTKNEHRRGFELGLPMAELRIDKDSGPWPNAPARYVTRLITIKPPTRQQNAHYC
jgi:hypothetical protein